LVHGGLAHEHMWFLVDIGLFQVVAS
jgi:hypothetical protein